ncbi:FCS-Like Zinc finger 8-like [Typha latifolia]|uniref:FCS-Like Zinc finger 8-like n=1 Tax=Typha latifolia TaxID=4733 RepID=UPI003C306D02
MFLRFRIQDIMLRRRSSSVGSKQSLASDNFSSPTATTNRPTSPSLFASPRLFLGLSSNGSSDSEISISPTSIIERATFFSQKNPTWAATPAAAATEGKHRSWCSKDSGAIGLGLVDALNDEKINERTLRPQLKIQIPPPVRFNSVSSAGSVESPLSPIEFGLKNKSSQLALCSPMGRSPMGSANLDLDMLTSSPLHEIELSEDYTCVITHGPNPKTTHIFDNCIVESCGDGFIPLRKESRVSAVDQSPCAADDFLSFCSACKKNLGQGKDTYMYRGERAFCSNECRSREMLFDERMQ